MGQQRLPTDRGRRRPVQAEAAADNDAATDDDAEVKKWSKFKGSAPWVTSDISPHSGLIWHHLVLDLGLKYHIDVII